MDLKACTYAVWRAVRDTSKYPAYAERCSEKFEVIKYFDLFAGPLKGNVWPLLALAVLLVPLIFVNIKYSADEFMAKSILRFQRRFKIGALIGAVTLIPLSNAGPDLLVTFVAAGKDEGVAIAMGSLIGAFTFVATVALGYVVYRSPNSFVRAPPLPVIKDAAFYGLGIVMIIAFGALGRTPRALLLVPLLLLAAYIAVSVYLARRVGSVGEEEALEAVEESKLGAQAYPTLAAHIGGHLYAREEPVYSAFFFPFKLFYMLTVPYNENPLAATPFLFGILAAAVPLVLLSFEVPSPQWAAGAPWLFFCALGLAASAAAFGALQLPAVDRYRVVVLDFLTLVVSIAFMKVMTDCLISSINFVSFVFGVPEAYLSMTVLSIGMSVSDVFSNGAIAATGDDVMALMGCVSSQIFNLFCAVAGYIFCSPKGDFDIFGKLTPQNASGRSLFILLLVFAFGALAFNCVHVWLARGYTKAFSVYSLGFYALFLALATIQAALS